MPVVNVEGRLYDVKIHYLDKIDKGRYLFALPPHALPGQLLSNPELKPEMYEAVVVLIPSSPRFFLRVPCACARCPMCAT